MAQEKKSFVAYCEWLESFEMLEDAEAGKLIKHLLRYVNDLNPEMEDRLLKIAFQPIKQQLKRDLNKYDEVRQKRAEAGKLGGLKTQAKAKQAKGKQKQANQAVNVNENGNVNDNVNVNERERKLSPGSLAFDLLKIYKTSELEALEMQKKKQVENWDKMIAAFNNKMELEISRDEIDWDENQLMPRFRGYVDAWINNQENYSKTKAGPEDKFITSAPKRF